MSTLRIPLNLDVQFIGVLHACISCVVRNICLKNLAPAFALSIDYIYMFSFLSTVNVEELGGFDEEITRDMIDICTYGVSGHVIVLRTR